MEPQDYLRKYERQRKAKKLLKYFLLSLICFFVISIATFPRSPFSFFDFKVGSPYLPISVPLQIGEVGEYATTTVYFVPPEDDEPIFVRFYLEIKDKNDLGHLWDFLREPHRKIASTDANGNQIYVDNENAPILHRYNVEISETVDGKEKLLVSRTIINPTGRSSHFAGLSHNIREDRIYKLQVTSEILFKRITEEAELELYICQGCQK
jgi:hypothetical protein